MTEGGFRKDLIVLVADKNMKFTLEGLLSRSKSLNIRLPSSSYDISIHLERDPGCFKNGHNFLRPFQHSHNYALVMFDREGCGQEKLSREELERQVKERMNQSGWNGRGAAIAIDPELENWVWTNSPHVETFLGWKADLPNLHTWLVQEGFLTGTTTSKPAKPKEAVEKAMRKTGKARSSALYRQLAENVSLAGCTDKAFVKFRQVLSNWFPASTTE
jgi:hypothetical protein